MTPQILAYLLQSLPPMLHMLQLDSMSSCSKAPRGLFVLVRTTGIFTGNALSPSPSLRQCPNRYAIRAGRNLPDKEFRYLRTVIVTAAVHWGFSSKRKPLTLTFQHWAGVSPYTSTFVLAETCVFGKQSLGLFSCGQAAPRCIQFSLQTHTSVKNNTSEPVSSYYSIWDICSKISRISISLFRSHTPKSLNKTLEQVNTPYRCWCL